MDPDPYPTDLCRLADAYQAGEITPDEFRRQMADLRDKRLERRKEQGRQP